MGSVELQETVDPRQTIILIIKECADEVFNCHPIFETIPEFPNLKNAIKNIWSSRAVALITADLFYPRWQLETNYGEHADPAARKIYQEIAGLILSRSGLQPCLKIRSLLVTAARDFCRGETRSIDSGHPSWNHSITEIKDRVTRRLIENVINNTP
jgi:hypothetical protein